MLAARTAIVLSIAGIGYGFQQAPSPQPAAVQTGLETPWDVRKIVADLKRDNQQFRPLLASMDPQQWFKLKDAPSTYIIQWQTAQRQLSDVEITTNLLSQKTDSLALALDTYFRLEALEVTTRSLDEGAQKYADRASADKLGALIAHNFNSRERLRDYLRDLASSTMQNFKIADEEAQRCRGIISKEPAPSSTKRSRKY